MVKCLSDTRWSAHFDALHAGYEQINDALTTISADTDQRVNTRQQAEGLIKRMENLETIILTIIWNDILERINKTSKILQSKDKGLIEAMNLLNSLKNYVHDMENKFDAYELKARKRCPESDYSDVNKHQ